VPVARAKGKARRRRPGLAAAMIHSLEVRTQVRCCPWGGAAGDLTPASMAARGICG
jgi:hypothetical protein